MTFTILDLRRRMSEVLRALDRNEPITILHRGKERAILIPVGRGKAPSKSVADHPFFGMWKGRRDLKDVPKAVRRLRSPRYVL